jgi:hypothetical protein
MRAIQVPGKIREFRAVVQPMQCARQNACLVDIGASDKPQLAQRRPRHASSLLSSPNCPGPRLQHEVQAELAEHSEHLVQPHRGLALLQSVNKTR